MLTVKPHHLIEIDSGSLAKQGYLAINQTLESVQRVQDDARSTV